MGSDRYTFQLTIDSSKAKADGRAFVKDLKAQLANADLKLPALAFGDLSKTATQLKSLGKDASSVTTLLGTMGTRVTATSRRFTTLEKGIRTTTEAVKPMGTAITGQTRSLTNYENRLKSVTAAVQRLGTAQKSMTGSGRVQTKLSGLSEGGALKEMVRETEEAEKKLMAVIAKMRKGQEGAFDPLAQEAREAADKIVGHSYIPDMVRDVERYLRSMKDDQRTAFDPLTAEARQAAQDVEVSMRRVREAQLQATKDRWAGVKGTGQSMANTGQKMMMAAGAATGAGVLVGRQFLEYAEPLGRASTNMELTGEMAEYLDERIRALSGTTSYFKPEEMASGLYIWAAATGATAESHEALDAQLEQTSAVQKLARLANMELGTAIEATTDILSQFQLNASETEDVVAKLVKVAAVSKAEVGDLAEAFSYVGTAAEGMNISFDETAATLQLLSNAGLRGSRAGRGLSMVLTSLVSPSKEAKDALDQVLGPDAFSDQEGNFIGIANVIERLADGMAGMTQMEGADFLNSIMDANAARTILPLINMQIEARKRNINAISAEQKILEGRSDAEVDAYVQMRQELGGYEISLKSATDTFNDQWGDYTKNVSGQMNLISARWSSTMVTMGKAITTSILPDLDMLTTKVNDLAGAATKNPDLVNAAIKGVGVVAAVGALTVVLGKGVQLIADVKMIIAAAQMSAAADKMLVASGQNMAAAGAGGGKLGSVAAAAGKMAMAAGAGYLAAEGASQVITGKSLVDFLNVSAERDSSKFMTEAQLAAMSPDEQRALIAQRMAVAEADRANMEEWRRLALEGPKGLIGSPERKEWEAKFSDVPEELFGKARWLNYGAPEPKLIESAQAEREGEIAAYSGILDALKAADAEASQGIRELAENTRDMTYEADITTGSLMDLGSAADNTGAAFYNAIRDLGAQKEALRTAVSTGMGGGKVTQEDLVQQAEGAGRAGWGRISGLAGMMSPKDIADWRDEYMAGMTDLFTDMRSAEQWQIDLAVTAYEEGWDARVDKVKASSRDIEKMQKDMEQSAEAAQSKYDSFLSGLLGPTSVTSEDMAAGDNYKPKWDEPARQMRAFLAGVPGEGFEAGKALLSPELLMGGDQAGIQNAGNKYIEDFYAGLIPEDVNWDALAEDFRAKMQEKQGAERLLQVAKEEMSARGLDLSDSEVSDFFGLGSPLTKMFFGNQSPEEAGVQIQAGLTTAFEQVVIPTDAMVAPGTSMAKSLSETMGAQFRQTAWTAVMVSAWQKDLTNNVALVEGIGVKMADHIFVGMSGRLRQLRFVALIVRIVMEKIAGAVEE